MSSLVGLLSVLLMLLFVACSIRASAFLLSRTVVSWKHAFLFPVILLVLTVAKFFTGFLIGSYLPLFFARLMGVAITLAIGSWFFSSRASNPQGSAVGWLGGLKLTALGLGLLLLIAVPLMLVMNALQPGL